MSTDVAWLGSARPRRALVISSGLHGIEGFVGSAIQLQILASQPVLENESALVLVHALNPWGMSWLRRTNRQNVDLNRNLLPPGQAWAGAPDGYYKLTDLLNPPTPPANDGFIWRAVLRILRFGFAPLKEAVLFGQYEFPEGLFFGGRSLQPELRWYSQWVPESFGAAEYVLAIDLHSGIGPWAKDTLFYRHSDEADRTVRLSTALGRRLEVEEDSGSVGYPIGGGIAAGFVRLLPRVNVDFITQDFGTVNPLFALAALRQENRWHHYGAGDIFGAAKAQLREVFCPSSEKWRQSVLDRAGELTARAINWMQGRGVDQRGLG